MLRLPGQVHVRSVLSIAQRQSRSGSVAGGRRLRPRVGQHGRGNNVLPPLVFYASSVLQIFSFFFLLYGQDGFYEGELLDGRKGLVPSNFIQRLQGEDLVEFHRAAVLGLQICGDDSSTTSLPRDLLGVSPNHPSHLRAGQHAAHQLASHPSKHQQPLHHPLLAANEPIDQGQ